MEMKKLVVPFTITETKQDDTGKYFTFEGYANTWEIDRGMDRSVRGCFEESINEMKAESPDALAPVLWQHMMDMPLGVYNDMGEKDTGLFVKGKMPLEDTFVSGRVVPQMKVGSVRKMSIRYIAEKFSYEEVDGMRIRNLEKVKLIEISLVTFPMNEGSDVTDMKGLPKFANLPIADANTPWNKSEAIERVSEHLGDDEIKSYFWKSCDNGSCELPFADVIDGKLTAIPRAILQSALMVRGVNGGVNIPEEDKKSVESHINRYYEEMGIESPLKEDYLLISQIDVKKLTERELEGILNCESVKFTAKASKFIVSCLDAERLRDESEAHRDDEKAEAKLDELIKTLEKRNDS